MSKLKRIVLAAGGTGGHFFPAIALAEDLSKYANDVHLITDYRCKKYIISEMPITPHILNIYINFSGLLNKFISIYRLTTSCIRSVILLLKLKPKLVVGFGGYPSFPTMLAARILKIPLIIQEQNCFFGQTNNFFAKYAKYISLSYKNTKNIPEIYNNKILFTGSLIRKSIRGLKKKKIQQSDTFHIFIVGGSQGASFFNQLIPETMKLLKELNPKQDLIITQQVCKEQQYNLTNIYKNLGIKYNLKSFFHKINDVYKNADLVISRSGATTIAELVSIGLPAIYIPLLHAKDNHQKFNAASLAKIHASWYYDQLNITPEVLAKKLYELISNTNLLIKASEKLLVQKTDGSQYLANTIQKIIV